MRSKAPLALMEQLVMLVVFALAAALCVQAFVLSDRLSRRMEARSRAAAEAQSVAELLRHGEGDMGQRLGAAARTLDGEYRQGLFSLSWDGDWNSAGTAGEIVYRLNAQGIPAGTEGLEKVHIWAYSDRTAGQEVLFELDVAWQREVSP